MDHLRWQLSRLLKNFLTTLTRLLILELEWMNTLLITFFRGEAMYPSADDVTYGGQGKVPEAAVDRMVADLEKQ